MPASGRQIVFGVLAFFLIKICFISIGFWSMNGPRLGDDAYVYLWYSLSSIFNDLGSSPALTSLEQFAASVPQQDIPAEARDNFYRILLRTGNIAQNYIHMFLGLIMPASWSFYALFWFQEFFIVIDKMRGEVEVPTGHYVISVDENHLVSNCANEINQLNIDLNVVTEIDKYFLIFIKFGESLTFN